MRKYINIIFAFILFGLLSVNCFAGIITKNIGKQSYRTTLGEDNDEVIIGDTKSASFRSQVTFTKWKDKNGIPENSLTIKIPDGLITSSSPTLVNGKVEVKDSKTGFYFNPDPDNSDNFKFGLILYEKPVTNTWTFQLEGWEEFDFFYQPPLANVNSDGSTWEDDAKRPADVNGSYAVYHKTKKDNDYKTGKFGHYYRPRFIDANGVTVWAGLSITNGLVSITIPQNFLDTAKYPIKANDTFGVTTVGASFGANYPPAGSWNSIYVAMATSPAGTNTLNSISWYLRSDATFSIKVGLYDSSDKSRDAYTSTAFSNTSTEGWKTSTGDLNVVLTASLAYSSAYYHASGGTYSEYAYDDNAGYQGYRTTGDLPATWSDTADPITRKASTYATYTASGGARQRMFVVN